MSYPDVHMACSISIPDGDNTPAPLHPYNLPRNTSESSENLGALELFSVGLGDITTMTLLSPWITRVGWLGRCPPPSYCLLCACHLLSCRQTEREHSEKTAFLVRGGAVFSQGRVFY